MTDQHISLVLIDGFTIDKPMQCLIIGKIISVFIRTCDLFYHGRFHKRKEVKIHLSVRIIQCYFFDIFCFHPRRLANHIYILARQNLSKTVNPWSAVVISTDHHDYRLWSSLCQFFQKTVKYLHCLCRWNCFIVNIPCDHNGIRLFPTCHLDNFRQNIFLIFPKITVHQF